MSGLLGKKIGMSQIFLEDGKRVPVTLLETGPCLVEQLKTKDTDGYRAVKLSFDRKFVREIRIGEDENYEKGAVIKADIFKDGDFVDVSGISIGKGFQGGIKRWHWKGGPASHGSTSHRRPGSIGSSTTPSRVFKGHHLPGHMGRDRVTTQNLLVVKVYTEKNMLAVKGAVPGHKNNYLVIKKAKKKQT